MPRKTSAKRVSVDKVMTDKIQNIQSPTKRLFSPVWSASLTRRRIKSGKALFGLIGREVKCHKCQQYWPADTEFFYSGETKRGGLAEWCKACYEEWRRARRAVAS